jgi:hypothetical protein
MKLPSTYAYFCLVSIVEIRDFDYRPDDTSLVKEQHCFQCIVIWLWLCFSAAAPPKQYTINWKTTTANGRRDEFQNHRWLLTLEVTCCFNLLRKCWPIAVTSESCVFHHHIRNHHQLVRRIIVSWNPNYNFYDCTGNQALKVNHPSNILPSSGLLWRVILKQYVIVIVCAGNNRQYWNISTAFTHFFNLQHSGENNSVLLAKLPLFSSPCHTW